MRLFCTVLICSLPIMAHAQPQFDVQGHRGARGLLPENTIPAFLRAIELGVTTLELDVVIAADSTVVVSHEPWMSEEICSLEDGSPVADPTKHNLFQLSYEEIARYDCGSRGNPRFPHQAAMAATKPRLVDVIAAAERHASARSAPPLWYNIETKSRPSWDGVFTPGPEAFTHLLYEVLVQTGIKDRSIHQSFDMRSLQAGHRIDPSWRTAMLMARAATLPAILDSLGFAPTIYSPQYGLVTDTLLREAHARGMRVIPWTVNVFEDMQRLKSLGVDGVITDYPDLGVLLLK